MANKIIYERYLWFENQTKTKKYPNATSLAQQFELSTKTTQRDIEFMRERLKCPLVYDKNRKGYYYSDNTFSLPFIHLSSDELSSLVIARKMLKDINSSCISDEINSVVNKITNILERHVSEPHLIDNSLSFQLIEYSPAPESVFKAVLEGCLKRKSLSFAYLSPAYEKKTVRTVDPYHLFNYMGTWHLIAYCHMRKALRTFNLSRITDLKVLNNVFTVEKNFDINKYLHSAFGIYKGKSIKTVTIRFSPQKTKWVKGQIWHRDQKEKWLKDGSLELTFPVSHFDEVKMEILKQGASVQVIKPKILRELIKEEAKKIAKIY